jgi:Predicted membrane protein (DUF2207)
VAQVDYSRVAFLLVTAALLFVVLYFAIAVLVRRSLAPSDVIVTCYEAPPNVSPALAAWLLHYGHVPRALAAAVVNMAAKKYVEIEQKGDLYSIYRLGPEVSLSLEPEEDALARTLFKGYDCFEFDETTPKLREAVKQFRYALMDTTYFSEHTALYLPPWIVSGFGILCAVLAGHIRGNQYTTLILCVGLSCFFAGVRTLPRVFEKAFIRVPVSTAPQRPWTSSDTININLLVSGLATLLFLAILSTPATAILTGCFLAVNGIFVHSLGGPTKNGRKVLAQVMGYRKFLAEVDADTISRIHSPEMAPAELSQKQAYALAFHLDLGWGEQFVSSIAGIVEYSALPDPRADA